MSSKIEVGSEAYTFGWMAGGGPFNAEGTDAHTVEVLAGKLRTWLFLTGFLLMAACAFCGLGLEQSHPESFADYVGEGTGHFDSNGWSISYDQHLQNWHKEHSDPAANMPICGGVSALVSDCGDIVYYWFCCQFNCKRTTMFRNSRKTPGGLATHRLSLYNVFNHRRSGRIVAY